MEQIENDLEMAQNLIEGKNDNLFGPVFHSHSIIYSSTNEIISSPLYKNCLTGKERVLSVIGSGDQILNSILLGSKDITGFDISRFTGYYLKLKIAALKTLKYKEYISFFECQNKNRFSKDLYDRMINNLDSETEYFWSNILSLYNPEILEYSDFFAPIERKRFKKNNPYLESKSKYDLLKSNIKDVDLNIIHADIFNLVDTLKGKYDLVNLSNIIDYEIGEKMVGDIMVVDKYSKDKINRLLEKVPMSKEGIILMYSMRCYLAKKVAESLTTEEIESKEYDIEKVHKLILSRKRK